MMLGLLIGGLLGGTLSDKFGRKNTILVATLAIIPTTMFAGYSPNYACYAFLRYFTKRLTQKLIFFFFFFLIFFFIFQTDNLCSFTLCLGRYLHNYYGSIWSKSSSNRHAGQGFSLATLSNDSNSSCLFCSSLDHSSLEHGCHLFSISTIFPGFARFTKMVSQQ